MYEIPGNFHCMLIDYSRVKVAVLNDHLVIQSSHFPQRNLK